MILLNNLIGCAGNPQTGKKDKLEEKDSTTSNEYTDTFCGFKTHKYDNLLMTPYFMKKVNEKELKTHFILLETNKSTGGEDLTSIMFIISKKFKGKVELVKRNENTGDFEKVKRVMWNFVPKGTINITLPWQLEKNTEYFLRITEDERKLIIYSSKYFLIREDGVVERGSI